LWDLPAAGRAMAEEDAAGGAVQEEEHSSCEDIIHTKNNYFAHDDT